MANDYYDHGSGVPATGSSGSSSTIRTELDSIASGFDKLPPLTGNADEAVFINSGATGMTSKTAAETRTALGLVIGTNVQAYNAALDEVPALLDDALGNGFLVQTGATTYTRRTVSAGSGISITNGDGVAGNPTITQTVIPAGTNMLFFQAAAPVGWTQFTGYNDVAMRVVNGAGGGLIGTVPYTDIFNSTRVTNETAITTAQMPAHSHAHTLGTATAGAHTHTVFANAEINAGAGSTYRVSNISSANDKTTSSDGAHSHTITGSISDAGSGLGHSHGITMDVHTISVIICTKD